ncbi:alpha/beta hydrolase family protein [Motilibacter peucedani]|uniref:Alpha/beta hydrolase family protein n=1 Tax=Motilibacter peucedani TaxID=598650 RepID=A0A420XK65_9ACTN|nr:alpha/beta fold hydrolase [Motilibacter peucedani]RKS68023.1 alpha/beta hydrolase family protein [Motilibacter peucedani]
MTAPPAVALVLHGGRERSTEVSRRRHLASLRMVPFAHALRRAGLETCSVRYRVRGWNADASPVADALAALERVREAYASVPVVLVGHSMGGRVALRLAGEPDVAGVVALAPWVPPGEPVRFSPGGRLRVLHGDRDTWTDPAGSRAYVQRAVDAGVDATWEAVPGDGHAMLRRAPLWHRLAVARALECVAVTA